MSVAQNSQRCGYNPGTDHLVSGIQELGKLNFSQ
jgi:hypothetical protein